MSDSGSPPSHGASASGPRQGVPTLLEPPTRRDEPRRRRPGRNRWKMAGAITVVVVIAVASIFVSGVLFPSSPNATSAPSFSGAQRAANSAANGYEGGSWNDIAAVALGVQSSITLPRTTIETIVGANSCQVRWDPLAPGAVAIPVTPATAPLGGASAWFFVYASSNFTLLMVSVTNGSAQPLFTASAGNCTLIARLVEPLSTTSVVDSGTALDAANAGGGSAYLAGHPLSNRTWAVVGQIFLVSQPTWYVLYSDCPLPPPVNSTVNRTTFTAHIDAQTGALINASTASAACTLALPAVVAMPGGLASGLSGADSFPVAPAAAAHAPSDP